MLTNPALKILRNIAITFFIVSCSISFLYAFDSSLCVVTNQASGPAAACKKDVPACLEQKETEKNLTELQKQARFYRQRGLQYQEIGNLDMALSFYQKAVELDPAYAIAFNDLGIIYEAKGESERAEASYLQCLKIDPDYLSAYSNLAYLYEAKRELSKAASYWAKRAELGLAPDPWKEKAIQRLADLEVILGQRSFDSQEEEVINLIKDVSVKTKKNKKNAKYSLKGSDKALALERLETAKAILRKGDELSAYREASSANTLDPSNKEIEEFLDKLQTSLLTK